MATPTLLAHPYINFRGKAREAMEFYRGIFGGKLDLLAMDKSGTVRPAEDGELLMHARLSASGMVIMATDGSPDFPPTVGDNMAVSLVGCEEELLRAAFDKLADGGKVKMALSDSAWGDTFGYLEDKFGINWMVDITKPENMSAD